MCPSLLAWTSCWTNYWVASDLKLMWCHWNVIRPCNMENSEHNVNGIWSGDNPRSRLLLIRCQWQTCLMTSAVIILLRLVITWSVFSQNIHQMTQRSSPRLRHGPRFCEFNSLVPGRCDRDFKNVSFEQMLQIKFMGTPCEITLRRMPQYTFEDKSILVQVMACCHLAISHYLSQCWPRYDRLS